ncbi:MAG: Arc family DNA-binding protein [Candidatus Ornithomonoglobus sp.]
MAEKNKHIGLRCSDEMLTKLKYISEYEGRSINGEILYLINCEIRRFEKENGAIEYTVSE